MWVWALRGSRHFKPAAYSVQPQLPHRGELIIVSLEYDTDRAGGFTLAEAAEHHHTVVLGLITSKDGKLEGENAVIERIHEVEQHLPLEQLHLPTQCGFSSTEEGHVLTEEDQWNKLALVRRIAEKV